jgi:hypothetical protein
MKFLTDMGIARSTVAFLHTRGYNAVHILIYNIPPPGLLSSPEAKLQARGGGIFPLSCAGGTGEGQRGEGHFTP